MTEFGLFFIGPALDQPSQQQVFDDIVEEIKLAEELGYDAVWVAEHHFNADFSLTPSANLILAAAAAVTTRIKIGAAINVLPFHSAVRQAEEGAMLDRLSHGRFQWGIGRGISGHEFDVLGIDPADSRDRFLEIHDAVTAAWRTGRMSYDGQFVKVPDTAIAPTPVQESVPVWVSAQSPSSIQWAAERDYPAMQFGEPLDQGRAQLARYHEAAAAAGVEVVRGGIVPLRQVYVAESDERARELCAPKVEAWWAALAGISAPTGANKLAKGYEYWVQQDPNQYVRGGYDGLNEQGLIITGSPETVTKGITEQVTALDAKHVILDFWRPSPRDERIKSMRLFAEEVMPAVR